MADNACLSNFCPQQTPVASIDHLPNEILHAILAPLATPVLLRLTTVSRPFHCVTVRILHQRLARAVASPGRELLLECYHSSGKLSTPYLHCDYLGTDGLNGTAGNADSEELSLHQIAHLYSRFLPVPQNENRRLRLRHPLHRWGGIEPHELSSSPSLDVFLEESEPSLQLITQTSLVKPGPKRDLFLSSLNVSEGLISVSRDWLMAQTQKQTPTPAPAEAQARAEPADEDSHEDILWADPRQTIGIRFRVIDTGRNERPILIGPDEDMAMSLRLEYQELLVRTTHLFVKIEQADVQELSPASNAIVIAGL